MVSAVTVMCSAAHGPEGITLDEEAQNARFDLKAARFVYSRLQAQRDVRFTVVTRHSAAACRLPRNSLNGSLHPVAKRLAASGPLARKCWGAPGRADGTCRRVDGTYRGRDGGPRHMYSWRNRRGQLGPQNFGT